jgi:hypothetical protein
MLALMANVSVFHEDAFPDFIKWQQDRRDELERKNIGGIKFRLNMMVYAYTEKGFEHIMFFIFIVLFYVIMAGVLAASLLAASKYLHG